MAAAPLVAAPMARISRRERQAQQHAAIPCLRGARVQLGNWGVLRAAGPAVAAGPAAAAAASQALGYTEYHGVRAVGTRLGHLVAAWQRSAVALFGWRVLRVSATLQPSAAEQRSSSQGVVQTATTSGVPGANSA